MKYAIQNENKFNEINIKKKYFKFGTNIEAKENELINIPEKKRNSECTYNINIRPQKSW